jgi:hypothetical protein
VCVCSFTLIIRHAKRISRICGLSGCTMFITSSFEQQDFREKICWTQNIYFDFLYKFLSEKYLIPWKTERVFIIKVLRSLCTVLAVIFRFKTRDFHFLSDFREILTYRISWKPVHWESSCYRQTDRQKARRTDLYNGTHTAFGNFVKAPKIIRGLK